MNAAPGRSLVSARVSFMCSSLRPPPGRAGRVHLVVRIRVPGNGGAPAAGLVSTTTSGPFPRDADRGSCRGQPLAAAPVSYAPICEAGRVYAWGPNHEFSVRSGIALSPMLAGNGLSQHRHEPHPRIMPAPAIALALMSRRSLARPAATLDGSASPCARKAASTSSRVTRCARNAGRRLSLLGTSRRSGRMAL